MFAPKASHKKTHFSRVISWSDLVNMSTLSTPAFQDARACPGHRASFIRALMAPNSSSTRALT